MKILNTKNIKDVKVDDRAYRRGYRHGYHQALKDIKNGHKLSNLYTWTKNLLKWNLRHNQFEFITPPIYPKKFIGDKK